MFGSSPGVFKNPTAASEAAKAYGKEEHRPWIVVMKLDDNKRGWYKPCRQSDLEDAQSDNWEIF